jgi:hypothetical protein
MSHESERARTYVTIVQAPEGYPADSELRKLEETPAPPVVHAVVLRDDYEKVEAENVEMRKALNDIAIVRRESAKVFMVLQSVADYLDDDIRETHLR